MKKVLIIGCGYGGIVCAWRLAGFKKKAEVTVLDRGGYFNFLPLLPDTIGRGFPPEALRYPIKELSREFGFNFINEEVKLADLANKRVVTTLKTLDYDYLVIASGSETNFYANSAIKEHAYKLDDASDAATIRSSLDKNNFDAYIISGGGYTGIEIATNLRKYLNSVSRNKRIIIIERAPVILGPLPQWQKDYVSRNLLRLNIEIFTNTVVEGVDEDRICVSGKGDFKNSMLIWAAGVKTSEFIQNLDVRKNPQGRINVDEYLRVNETCFAIGDAAYFSSGGQFLRMAVQFAIAQGSSAAKNIINSIMGKPLNKYNPLDMGYIIPMANNRACGNIFGINMNGFMPIVCHYVMSVYRAYGIRNKLSIVNALLQGGGK